MADYKVGDLSKLLSSSSAPPEPTADLFSKKQVEKLSKKDATQPKNQKEKTKKKLYGAELRLKKV
ncbi:hypothetical protein DPMN_086672 [Dreissena polymorpha]|uniref:Uncharacterized protein n=1 Tax=Dreissena polymorpha TaxID=45954 RepID=A0A9D4KRW0_DREPO|nr:hypothetical protein DPMN_086672 [Dreissena polymorpha]